MKKYISLILSALCVCYNANATSIKQSFKVKIGLFDAATADIAYTLSNDSYRFFSSIKTSGLFNKLYSFNANYTTKGMIEQEKLITQYYHQTTKSSSHEREKELIFDQNGILIKRISAKDSNKRKVKVTLPKTTIDTFDIQSVLVMLIREYQQNESCELHKTVFNGKKLYNITIKDNGRTLFKDKRIPISGEAHHCTAFIHQQNAEEGDLLWQVSSEKYISFYLTKEKTTGLPYLLKMEIASTPLGKLEAYMTDLQIKE